MKLQNLDNYKENFSDEIIFNNLIKSSDKDLIEYTINVTSDLLNGVFLTDEFKANAKANLKNYDENVVDKVITVSDEDSFEMVRVLANKLGILVGISSGANTFAALEIAKKYPNKKIVTVAPDGIDKYMSMGIF